MTGLLAGEGSSLSESDVEGLDSEGRAVDSAPLDPGLGTYCCFPANTGPWIGCVGDALLLLSPLFLKFRLGKKDTLPKWQRRLVGVL